MKGIKQFSKKTQEMKYGDQIPLYYDIANDTVYRTAADGRFLMTYIINPCTPKEIEQTVHYFLNM